MFPIDGAPASAGALFVGAGTFVFGYVSSKAGLPSR
jgi:hypothetical protein